MSGNPQCNCCCPVIASDDFNRANNTSLGPDWSENSGAWAITSNKLVCTTAGQAIFNTVHPDAGITMAVGVDVNHNTAGSNSSANVIVGYIDANNYYYARYIFGSSGVQILRVAAGVHTLRGSGSIVLSVSNTYRATVCVDAFGTISASVDGVVIATAPITPITGTQCGLAGQGSGIATFDNFVFEKSHDAIAASGCDKCNAQILVCQQCCSFIYSTREVIVDFGVGGLVDTGSCTFCDQIVGEWTLPHQTTCTWRYPTPLTCSTQISASLTVASGLCRWSVNLTIGSGGTARSIVYTMPIGSTAYDCAESGPWVLALSSDTAGIVCGGSPPATVVLSLAP